MYGHIAKRMLAYFFIIICAFWFFFRYKVAEAEKAGIESAGGKAEIYQYVIILLQNAIFLIVTRVQETLPEEVLTKMYAPPKPNYPIITPDILTTFDAFILGVPTRFGNMPAQWKVGNHS